MGRGEVIYSQFEAIPRFHYGMIMADPPWKFKNYSKKGEKKSASAQYNCMSIEQIKAMRVGDLAGGDCLLWLWATSPLMEQCFSVMRAWGFTPITCGSWMKITKTGKMQWGPGYWLRTTEEPYIIGKIGKPRIACRAIPSGFMGLAREHSRKPEEGYLNAEKMAPDAWRLDLFSRSERAGWDSFGDEADKFSEGEAA